MLIPEGLAVGVGVLEAHLLKLTAPIQLIVASVRLLSEVLHVHSDQHLPQLHKVTVVLILNYKENKQRRGRPSAVTSLRSKVKLQRGSPRHTGCLAGSSLHTQGSPDKGGREMVPREGLYNLSFTFQQFCLPNRDSSPAEAEVWVWDAADDPTGVVTSGSKVRSMTTNYSMQSQPSRTVLKYHHSS